MHFLLIQDEFLIFLEKKEVPFSFTPQRKNPEHVPLSRPQDNVISLVSDKILTSFSCSFQ